MLTPDYAEKIGADFYARDAKETVRYCKKGLRSAGLIPEIQITPGRNARGLFALCAVAAEDICRLCIVGGHSVVNRVAVLLYEAVVELVHFIGGVVLVSGLLIVNALFKGGLDLVRLFCGVSGEHAGTRQGKRAAADVSRVVGDSVQR